MAMPIDKNSLGWLKAVIATGCRDFHYVAEFLHEGMNQPDREYFLYKGDKFTASRQAWSETHDKLSVTFHSGCISTYVIMAQCYVPVNQPAYSRILEFVKNLSTRIIEECEDARSPLFFVF